MDTSVVPAPLATALLEAGYRVGGPAGVGGGGPVWTATRVAPPRSGRAERGTEHGPERRPERVVAHVVAVPDDAARARLAQRVDALRALDHPHLPSVVDVVVVPRGARAAGEPRGVEWVVLLAEVPGATVGALLAARGRLSRGELVTLVVPVAGALDALHRCGLVHGDVSPANLVVRPDGRPVLIDVLSGAAVERGSTGRGATGTGAGTPARGTPGFTAPEASGASGVTGSSVPGPGTDGLPAGAPADVFALAGVALAALDLAEHGGRIGAELRAATAREAIRRPTAAELAAALFACAEPEPIAQPDAGVLARTALAQLAAPTRTVSAPDGARHRLRRRRAGRAPAGPTGRWMLAAGLAVGLAVPGGAWVASHRGGPAPVAPAAGAAPAAGTRTDPVEAAVALSRRRADVLAAGDPSRLTEVVLAESPAHRADRALLDRIAAAGGAPGGLRAVVEEAALVPTVLTAGAAAAPSHGVEVRVRSGMTADARSAAAGAAGVPAQPLRAVVLHLVWTGSGWRVAEVRPG